MKNYIVWLVLFLFIVFNGCSKDESNPVVPDTGGTGTVSGQVFSKNGLEKIQGASVTVENLNNSPQTFSDLEGKYTLSGVPTGSQNLLIQKGLFKSIVSVTVTEGATVNAPAAQLEASGKLGFVSGLYDNIQQIIRNNLGYSIDSLGILDLRNTALLSNYKAIFINCGADEILIYDGQGMDALTNYIQNGGSIYASDWAGEFVEFMFPDKLTIETTGMSQVITAKIVDQNLKNFIGKETVVIDYDLGGWGEVSFAGQSVTTLLSADYTDYMGNNLTNKPLAVTFNHGAGKVIYTSFHNEANVTTDAIKVLIGFLYTL